VNGTYFSLEKNEVITVGMNPKNTPESESISVHRIPHGLTTLSMLERTRKAIGNDNLFIFSAQHRNCQDFVAHMLKANGMGSADVLKFVKQDADSLFKDTGFLRKIANISTDLASRIDVLKEGGGVSDPGYLWQSEKRLNGGRVRK